MKRLSVLALSGILIICLTCDSIVRDTAMIMIAMAFWMTMNTLLNVLLFLYLKLPLTISIGLKLDEMRAGIRPQSTAVVPRVRRYMYIYPCENFISTGIGELSRRFTPGMHS